MSAPRARSPPRIPGRCPGSEVRADHNGGRAVDEDEGAVGELVEQCVVETAPARRRVDPLTVKLRVDRVRSDLAGVESEPDLAEAVVVFAPAEGTRAMAGGQCRRLVEEEQLGVAARLHEG